MAKTQKKQQSNGISDFINELWQAAVNLRGSSSCRVSDFTTNPSAHENADE